MSVNLLTNISDRMHDPRVRNWFNIRNLIPSSKLTDLQLDLAQAHDSTFYKIRFADYHLFILGQIYDPDAEAREGETQQWVRAEMHSTVYNLYSALDSLGYEINLAYGFGINPGGVTIHHNHPKIVNGCLRCELTKINDDLYRYLETSLNDVSWFNYFRRLRNQVTHRHFPVWNIGRVVEGNGGRFAVRLPDNPENMNPQPSDYSRHLEVRQYCESTREEVINVTEEVYRLITPMIRQRYGFK
jgi:hypothetical protein